MPKAPEVKLDLGESLRVISEELRSRADKPNIFGYAAHYKQNKFHSHGRLNLPKGSRGIFINLVAGGVITDKASLKLFRLYVGGNRSGKTVGGNCRGYLVGHKDASIH
jgi:hypothetical protein